MAMLMKSWYVTVMDGYKQIFQKKCMSAKEATTVYDEKKKEYTDKKYLVLREYF